MDLSYCTYSEYDTDGFLGIQADAYSSGGRGVGAGHHLSPGGLDHRPVDPQGEIGELCLVIPDGHQNFVLPLNDVRTEAALPNLNKGATRLFDTGGFGEFPFRFTFTLDPVEKKATWKANRVGDTIEISNAEGLTLKLSGSEVTISGATAVNCGGSTPLALAPLVATALGVLKGAIAAGAAAESQSGGMGGCTAAAGALSAFPPPVAAQLTKGF